MVNPDNIINPNRHLKQCIQEFHRKYVLVPADKAANNVVVGFTTLTP